MFVVLRYRCPKCHRPLLLSTRAPQTPHRTWTGYVGDAVSCPVHGVIWQVGKNGDPHARLEH
jgi:hypothetical protein